MVSRIVQHRICGDCHAVIELIAKMLNRKIRIGDSKRFHDFDRGACSCGGHWWKQFFVQKYRRFGAI